MIGAWGQRHAWIVLLVSAVACTAGAQAAPCGNTAAGFEAWKPKMAAEAQAAGIGSKGIAALEATSYAIATIRADRGQKSFKLGLEAFMKKRGAAGIVQRGRTLKAQHAKLLAAIEKRYGVPAGPLLAIWGMETGFGADMGKENTLSAIATLAYDCRRSAFFTEHLLAALKLVDKGRLSATTKGAKHGEVGHTQFLPKSILLYGVDGDGDGRIDLNGRADALASTANFLRAHGWVPGSGYQPGEPSFVALQGWNAASVYQQAIAIIAKRIEAE